MSKPKRKALPQKMKDRILVESGHRCAIPTCRTILTQNAHIYPLHKKQDDSFENLIALCPNCHFRYDVKNDISLEQMRMYKSNLGILNQRYCDFERRIFEYLAETKQLEILLIGLSSEILLRNAVKDGLLVSRPGNNGWIGEAWEKIEMTFYYTLTKRGEDFIKEFYPEI